MIQQARRRPTVEESTPTPEQAPMPLEAGNRELLERLLPLPAERDEEEDRPWLDGPEFEVASMLAALKAPMPLPMVG